MPFIIRSKRTDHPIYTKNVVVVAKPNAGRISLQDQQSIYTNPAERVSAEVRR